MALAGCGKEVEVAYKMRGLINTALDWMWKSSVRNGIQAETFCVFLLKSKLPLLL